jgi:hypothetical protein
LPGSANLEQLNVVVQIPLASKGQRNAANPACRKTSHHAMSVNAWRGALAPKKRIASSLRANDCTQVPLGLVGWASVLAAFIVAIDFF